MTDSTNIYKHYNIDLNRLSRDYIKFPLKRTNNRNTYEYPTKEDIEYLYLELNLNKNELLDIFKTSIWHINCIIKKHIKKHLSIDEIYDFYKIDKNILNNCITLYDKIKYLHNEKLLVYQDMCLILNTSKIKLYNFIKENNLSLNKNEQQLKIEQQNILNYGCKTTFSNKHQIKKSKLTKTQKYNDEHFNNIQKRKTTCLEKYGVASFTKTQKFKDILKLKYNIIQQKSKNTCLEKYGVEYPQQSKQVNNKSIQTKIKNNTINKSKLEDNVYEIILSKFNNVYRQYKTNVYPFACDFYIPELNLYIETNFHWTHGNEPFNENSKKCIDILNIWNKKSKESKFYRNAVKVWVVSDPLKRKTAKEHNLNWIEFFNMKEFMKWFETI